MCQFPCEFGITGFVFKADAVNWMNDLHHIMKDHTCKTFGKTFAVGQFSFNRIAQAFFEDKFSVDYPYDSKIDNFLEVKPIVNYVYTSIRDEELPGETKPIGVCQFINKKNGDITQEDLLRSFHVRKLVGAACKKAEIILECFMAMVGLAEKGDPTGDLKEMVTRIEALQNDSAAVTLNILLG